MGGEAYFNFEGTGIPLSFTSITTICPVLVTAVVNSHS
jgi:hypothetical protein